MNLAGKMFDHIFQFTVFPIILRVQHDMLCHLGLLTSQTMNDMVYYNLKSLSYIHNIPYCLVLLK